MAFSIIHETFESGKDYLLITFEDEFNLDVVKTFAPRVVLAILHNQCFRLVEDLRKTTINLKSDELIKIQRFQEEFGVKHGILFNRVSQALIINENNPLSYEMVFFESLNKNFGQKMRVFSNMVEAIKWITDVPSSGDQLPHDLS